MITKASAKYIRIGTRKVRKVMDLVRGMSAVKADALLSHLNKRPCLYIKRVLRSAVDSADKRFHIPASSLYISMIKADQGPIIKRFRAASMGRATEFLHRTTHIILELDQIKVLEKKSVAEQDKKEKKTSKIKEKAVTAPAQHEEKKKEPKRKAKAKEK
ncbi:MAG: 50S ribosomal protein L22 [Candidatus Omnitrophota bacterium]|nr:50S ribosomal protein L22 [Candidatus Omnitrophota bacterium]